MTTKDRLHEFLEAKKLSKRQFYAQTGLSNGFLDKGESIGSDNLEKIISVYTELSLQWLVTGQGDMLLGAGEGDNGGYLAKRRALKQQKTAVVPGEKPSQGIPIYNVPIDASFLERYREDIKGFEPIGFLNLPRLRNCDFAALISGNSMYPLMKSGSIVVCKIVENFDYFDEGEMYFVSTVNGFETVKYVQSGDNPDELKLIPHNEKIKPSIIKKSMVIRMCLVEAWVNFR